MGEKPLFDRLHDQLRVDRNKIGDELVDHPNLVFQVYNGYTASIARRDSQQEKLTQLISKTEDRIREALLEESGKKPTIAQIEAAVNQDDTVIEERHALLSLKHEVSKWNGLKEAVSARSYCLHSLVEMEVAEIRATANTSR